MKLVFFLPQSQVTS